VKSKPVYAALELDGSARRHLVLALGPEGLEAAQRLVTAHPEALAAVLALDDCADWDPLDQALENAGMDTAFYLAGPEVFLWQAANALRGRFGKSGGSCSFVLPRRPVRDLRPASAGRRAGPP